MSDHWDHRFLQLAQHVASWSKDPSTKVGAVVVNDLRQVVSMGFNGFPRGVADTEERLNDRETKYKLVVHAEANALINSAASVRGGTMYIWPFPPCSSCAAQIVQAGIARVVSIPSTNERWAEAFRVMEIILAEGGVELDYIRDLEAA